MFGLKERPYPAHLPISFWCDSNNGNLDFLRFRILTDILVLFIVAIIKIEYYNYTPRLRIFLNICRMYIGHKEFAPYFFSVFQLLQQNPRWPPKSYMSLSKSLNCFMDLYYAWFKG